MKSLLTIPSIFDSSSHLSNGRPSLFNPQKIFLPPLLFLLIGIFLLLGSVPASIAQVEIDTNSSVLCEDLGNLDRDRELVFGLSPASNPSDNTVVWDISPSVSGTSFVGGFNTGSTVLIKFAKDAKVYTLTATGPSTSDSIQIVVGPTARVVSFIDGFNFFSEIDAVVAKAHSTLGQPAQELEDNGKIGEGLFLFSLTTNQPPNIDPITDDTTDWTPYVELKDYRGHLYVQPVAFFEADNTPICSFLMKNENTGFTDSDGGFIQFRNGFTNIPLLENFPGEQIDPVFTSLGATSGSLHHKIRMGQFDQDRFNPAFGTDTIGIPFASHEIQYSLTYDSGAGEFKYQYVYNGSEFPSHFVYMDGNEEAQRFQNNLADFIYAGDQNITEGTIAVLQGTVDFGAPITDPPATCAEFRVEPNGKFHNSPDATSSSFQVITDSGCSWNLSESSPWITNVLPASGSGTQTINYDVSTNPDTLNRADTIDVTAGATTVEFSVTQAGSCSFFTEFTTDSFDAAGGSGFMVGVTTLGNCTWSAESSDPSWLQITAPSGSHLGAGDVIFTLTANGSTFREGTIDIKEGTDVVAQFTVLQDGNDPTFTLIPNGRTHASGPDAGIIDVSSTSGSAAWNATANASWIILSPTSTEGTGDGNIVYSLVANTEGRARAGVIRVEDKNATIEQLETENEAPTAVVTASSNDVAEFVSVTIDGQSSSDPDGDDIISYQWTQIGGTPVTIPSGSTTDSFSFLAPDISVHEEFLEFQLDLTDENDNQSLPAFVQVKVTDPSIIPPGPGNCGEVESPDVTQLTDLDGDNDHRLGFAVTGVGTNKILAGAPEDGDPVEIDPGQAVLYTYNGSSITFTKHIPIPATTSSSGPCALGIR